MTGLHNINVAKQSVTSKDALKKCQVIQYLFALLEDSQPVRLGSASSPSRGSAAKNQLLHIIKEGIAEWASAERWTIESSEIEKIADLVSNPWTDLSKSGKEVDTDGEKDRIVLEYGINIASSNIEKLIGFPFLKASEKGVKAAISAVWESDFIVPHSKDVLSMFDATNRVEIDAALMDVEVKVGRTLGENLRALDGTVVVFSADTLSGGSVVTAALSALGPVSATGTTAPYYQTVYVLRPDILNIDPKHDEKNIVQYYKRALYDLFRGLAPSDATPTHEFFPHITDYIAGNNALVVFASAHVFGDEVLKVGEDVQSMSSPLKVFLSALSLQTSTDVTTVFVARAGPELEEYKEDEKDPTDKQKALNALRRQIKNSPQEHQLGQKLAPKLRIRNRIGSRRFEEFRNQFSRCCDWRQDNGYARINYAFRNGERLKTSFSWYSYEVNEDVYARSIKMRAFFASNPAIAGFNNAQLGFRQLAGTSNLPFDIQLFHDDMEIRLATIQKNQKNGLKSASTAKFWVREHNLSIIANQKKIDLTRGLIMQKESGRESLLRRENRRWSGEDDPLILGSLDLKAHVIDAWKAELVDGDPAKSSFHHWFFRAAKILIEDRQQGPYSKEIPVWQQGEYHLQFWPEILRQLMMSVFGLKPSVKTQSTGDISPKGNPHIDDLKDPSRIVNYCFDVIYLRILNGDGYKPLRSLSRRYGSDWLDLEMLQLMSADYTLGCPHILLSKKHHKAYHRACAYALIGVGQLDEAEKSLMQLGGIPVTTGAHLARLSGDREKHRSVISDFIADPDIDVGSDLEVIKYLIEGTNEELRDAQLRLDRVVGSDNEAESLTVPFREARDAKRLLMIRGQDLRTYQASSLWFYLARFHERKAEKLREQIAELNGCEQAAAENLELQAILHIQTAITIGFSAWNNLTKLHYSHEALAFRLILTRLERSQPKVAQNASRIEAELDDVYQQILDIGCSYEIYLEFLIEAARAMLADGRPLRGLAAFALPAYRISQSVSFKGHEARAKEVALLALDQVKDMYEKHEKGWDTVLDKADQHDHEQRLRYNEPHLALQEDGQAAPTQLKHFRGHWMPDIQEFLTGLRQDGLDYLDQQRQLLEAEVVTKGWQSKRPNI